MDKRLVLLVGIVCVAIGALLAANAVGVAAGLTLAVLLAWTFGLAFGANLALTAILRGPNTLWKALAPSFLGFAPILLGMMPAGNWMTMSHFPEGRLPHSLLPFPLVLILWGFVAPGGFLVDGLRRLRAPRP